MTPDKIRALIKGRIEDEHRKHGSLDWAQIAANKIYSQWSEFYESEMIEFANYCDINFVPTIQSGNVKHWQKVGNQSEEYYTTEELLELFKNRI